MFRHALTASCVVARPRRSESAGFEPGHRWTLARPPLRLTSTRPRGSSRSAPSAACPPRSRRSGASTSRRCWSPFKTPARGLRRSRSPTAACTRSGGGPCRRTRSASRRWPGRPADRARGAAAHPAARADQGDPRRLRRDGLRGEAGHRTGPDVRQQDLQDARSRRVPEPCPRGELSRGSGGSPGRMGRLARAVDGIYIPAGVERLDPREEVPAA